MAAIAGGSVAAELLAGRSLAAALALDPAEIESSLGGLPPGKLGCAALALGALRAALEEYQPRRLEFARPPD